LPGQNKTNHDKIERRFPDGDSYTRRLECESVVNLDFKHTTMYTE